MQHNRAAVAAFYFCMGLCFSTWASRIPDIQWLLNLSKGELGTILFALPAGQLSALPFSGRVVTRFGSTRTLPVGVFLYSSVLCLIGLASEPWHLIVALFLFGVTGNLSNISVNTQGVSVEQKYARPIMASFHGAWSLAGFFGAMMGLVAIQFKISAYQHLALVATFVMIMSLVFKKYLVLIPPTTLLPPRKKLFSKPEGILFGLGIIGFFSMSVEGAMFDWSGVYFRDIVVAPQKLVPLGYAAFMITMSLGRFVADRLIAKFGRRKWLTYSGILISLGMFSAVLFPALLTATLAFLCVGFGVSAVVPTIYSLAGKSSTTPGIALAKVTSVSYFGFLLGPPVIGWIASLTSLRVSFGIIGFFGLGICYVVSRLDSFDA